MSQESPSVPVVSVLCLTFNQVNYLGQAIESFLAQKTDFPIEILINDDCSTDGTTEVALEYQKRHPDLIHVVTHEQNQYSQGIMPIEGFLAPLARGRYWAICEGDDYYTDPTKLQRQFEAMEADPSLTACVHANENVQASTCKRLSVMRRYNCDCAVDPADVLTQVQCFSTNSLFIRREAMIGYLSSLQKNCPADGDQKMMTYFATRDGGMWYLDRIMSAYRFLAKNSINRTSLTDADMREVARRRLDGRRELLKTVDETTQGRFHEAVEAGLDAMEYAYYKDIRDYRTLSKRWPDRFGSESLPARMDSFLYTYLRPLHTLAYGIYYRL